MKENCFVMIKPEFANDKELVSLLKNEILKLGYRIETGSYAKYTERLAEFHYVDKKNQPFFKELVDYISSDVVYGFIICGDDAINTVRAKVEELRGIIKEKYPFFSLTKNGIHCTSKHRTLGIDVDSKREIDAFLDAVKNYYFRY